MDEAYRETIHAFTTAQRMRIRLLGQHNDKATEHPAHAVEASTGLVFIPVAPVERFSSERPRFVPENAEQEGWLPIDTVFGRYHPTEREVIIFHDQICDYAPGLGLSTSALETIVRLHEFAHGLVHLGTEPHEVPQLAVPSPEKSATDWTNHIVTRTVTYAQFDSDAHELLAQAITWHVLDGFQHLREAFTALMEKQPPHYRLKPEVLAGADRICWPALFAALRHSETENIARRHQLAEQIADALISAPECSWKRHT